MSSVVISVVRAGALALTLSGCAGLTVIRPAERPATVVTVDRVENRSEDRRPLGVPPGHYPPPGQCRVWFPGRPPGQQPRAGQCAQVERSAPAGSMILYRPASDTRVVHSRVIDSRRAGVVVSIRVYDAARGTYIRAERR